MTNGGYADTSDQTESTSSRHAEMLDASIDVFVRYGYRKTSMDDLARAVNLSRQGLYLHFRTKEALFHAAVQHLVGKVRVAALAELDRDDIDLAHRLTGALDALCGGYPTTNSTSVAELLETATALSGPLLEQLRHDVVAAMAELLQRSGIAARWQETGVTATDLAEHLFVASSGITQTYPDAERQRHQLLTAVRIVIQAPSA